MVIVSYITGFFLDTIRWLVFDLDSLATFDGLILIPVRKEPDFHRELRRYYIVYDDYKQHPAIGGDYFKTSYLNGIIKFSDLFKSCM